LAAGVFLSPPFFLSSFFVPLLLSVVAADEPVADVSVPVLEPDALLPVVLPLLGLLEPVALEPVPLPDDGALLLGLALLLLGEALLLDESVELGDGVEVEFVVVLGSGDFAGWSLPPQAVAIATSAPRTN
jgi:hypothetical protein